MAGRIERTPAGADDMAGMNDGRREAAAAGGIEQEGLDRGLLDAVLAERTARGGLGGGDGDGMAVDPDRAAVEEVGDTAAERVDEMLGARQREADHVDDDVRAEVADLRAERAGDLGRVAVDDHGLDRIPRRVRAVGLPLAAGDVDHLVPGGDEARHQIGADVTASPDHHHARHAVLLPQVLPAGDLSGFGGTTGSLNRRRSRRPGGGPAAAASRCGRGRPRSAAGSISAVPRRSGASSTAKPGGSVAISNRMPPRSRK